MEIKILNLSDVLYDYCKIKQKAVLYYEVKPRTEEEKNKILEFYKGKIPSEIYHSLKTEDDNFIEFNSDEYAIEFAEEVFSTKDIIENIDPLYYIYVEVYSNEGSILWTNV